MSKRRDAKALARWDTTTRAWATSSARDLALALYHDQETPTRPYGVGVVLDPGEKVWAEIPALFSADMPVTPPGQPPRFAMRPWLVTTSRVVGRLGDDCLYGWRWQSMVGARVDLTTGAESVALDINGERPLFWSGPGVAPLGVATIYHLHGPGALVDHPGLAVLRSPPDPAWGTPHQGQHQVDELVKRRS